MRLRQLLAMQIGQQRFLVFVHPLPVQRVLFESRRPGLLHHDAQVDLVLQGIPARLSTPRPADRPSSHRLPAAMILSLICPQVMVSAPTSASGVSSARFASSLSVQVLLVHHHLDVVTQGLVRRCQALMQLLPAQCRLDLQTNVIGQRRVRRDVLDVLLEVGLDLPRRSPRSPRPGCACGTGRPGSRRRSGRPTSDNAGPCRRPVEGVQIQQIGADKSVQDDHARGVPLGRAQRRDRDPDDRRAVERNIDFTEGDGLITHPGDHITVVRCRCSLGLLGGGHRTGRTDRQDEQRCRKSQNNFHSYCSPSISESRTA